MWIIEVIPTWTASVVSMVIMLFLGGFVLAIAASKVGLDVATAAMMLTFLAPVLASLPEDEKGKVGLKSRGNRNSYLLSVDYL